MHQPRAVERQPWVKATSRLDGLWLSHQHPGFLLLSSGIALSHSRGAKKDCCLKEKDQSEPRPKPMQPLSGLEATLLPPDCLLQKTNQRNPKARRNLIEFRQGESRSPQGRRHCMNVTRTVPIRSLPFISAGVSTSSEGLESFS